MLTNYKILSLILIMFLIGCNTEVKDVSFRNDVMPILVENCTSCHRTGGMREDVNFDDYNSLMRSEYSMNGHKTVIPGDPEASRLYIVVNSTRTGIMMPPPYSGLDQIDEVERKIIYTWIKEGAKNN